ncbi:hypothetical protein JOD27_001086 [Lentzea nigeriaca]|nr:hypothetical protein [Lentzea nigeriaca]
MARAPDRRRAPASLDYGRRSERDFGMTKRVWPDPVLDTVNRVVWTIEGLRGMWVVLRWCHDDQSHRP